MTNRDDEKIIKLLENLPQHKDKRPQQEIYEKLTLQFKGKSQRKNKRFIPYVAALSIFLLLLGLPFVVNHNITEQTTMETDATDERAIFGIEEESSHTSDDNMESTETFEREGLMEISLISGGVLTDVPSDREVIHFATYNATGEYVIPLTFLVPEEADMESYYAQLDVILNAFDLLPDHYILEGAEFSIDLDTKQVVLTMQNELLEDSNSNELLPQLLGEMFLPYGIEEVTFVNDVSETTQTIDLSTYAKQRESYFLYGGNYIIVPLDNDSTVEEALHALKQSYSDSQIKPVMDADIEFTVEEAGETVIVEFVQESIQEADVTIQMVEAILLTAKSFGYTEVQFDQLPFNQLEGYNFNSPLPVPTAVNIIADIK